MNEDALDQLADLLAEKVLARLSERKPVAQAPSPSSDDLPDWDWDEFGWQYAPTAAPAEPPRPNLQPSFSGPPPLPKMALDGSPVYTVAPAPLPQIQLQHELERDWARMRAAGVDPAKRPAHLSEG